MRIQMLPTIGAQLVKTSTFHSIKKKAKCGQLYDSTAGSNWAATLASRNQLCQSVHYVQKSIWNTRSCNLAKKG